MSKLDIVQNLRRLDEWCIIMRQLMESGKARIEFEHTSEWRPTTYPRSYRIEKRIITCNSYEELWEEHE